MKRFVAAVMRLIAALVLLVLFATGVVYLHFRDSSASASIAPAHPALWPATWPDSDLTIANLGHATLLMNYYGLRVISDPTLFDRVGFALDSIVTVGPHRYVVPPLKPDALGGALTIVTHFRRPDGQTLDSRTAFRWLTNGRIQGAKNMPTTRPALTASRFAARAFAVLGILVMIAIIGATPALALADDDWEAVQDSSSPGTEAPAPARAPIVNRPAPSSHRRAASSTPADAADAANALDACGEKAVAPSPKIRGIVSEINAAWGSNVRVYQSVAPEGPHALDGGCIFYNPAALAILLDLRLNLNDPNVLTPMLYAIFAHEVGHEIHQDFAAPRSAMPNQIKELEADRFAGYTMEKLDVPATGLAPYWSMTGDEFGLGASHGTSEQRVAAFKEGWHEAEWKRAENSMSVTAATQESVAPEDSSSAP